MYLQVLHGQPPSPRLPGSDMRTNQANKLRHSWRLGPHIVLGVQDNLVVCKADRHAFHHGDFVTVLATVDLSSKFTYNTKSVRATFKPIQIIRLATFTMVKELFPLEDLNADDVDMVVDSSPARAKISLDPSLV